MEVDQAITYIAILFLIILGLLVVVNFFFGGLANIDIELQEENKEDYIRYIVLEDTLTSELETSWDEFDHSRGYMPIEAFTQNHHSTFQGCHFDEVSSLTSGGHNVVIDVIEPEELVQDSDFDNDVLEEIENSPCYIENTLNFYLAGSVSTPVLLDGEDTPPIQAELYITGSLQNPNPPEPVGDGGDEPYIPDDIGGP